VPDEIRANLNKNLNASLPLSGNYYCIKCPDGSRGTHFTHELYLRKFWKAKRLKISTLRCHRVEITVLNARTDQGELISRPWPTRDFGPWVCRLLEVVCADEIELVEWKLLLY